MEDKRISLEVFIGFILFLGIIQWFVLREVGNLDGDRKDWWERLEDYLLYQLRKRR